MLRYNGPATSPGLRYATQDTELDGQSIQKGDVVEATLMNKDELFMHKAIEISLQARKEGNEPFGAILVKNDEIMMIGESLKL